MKIIIAIMLLSLCCESALGAVRSETRAVDEFRAISVNITADVFYKTGKAPYVRITAAKELISLIVVTVKNGELILQTNEPAKMRGKVIVETCSSGLNAILLTSAGNVTAKGLKSDTAHFVLTGSGNIKASGIVGEVVVNVTGSGGVDVAELIASRLQIDLFGNGSIESHASDYAYVHNMGSGQVIVAGNPIERKLERHGSGAILFK